MKTQKQRILEALKNWISPAEAFRQCGTMKLATRVGELRLEGHQIDSQWADNKAYKVYRLRPAKPQTKWVK